MPHAGLLVVLIGLAAQPLPAAAAPVITAQDVYVLHCMPIVGGVGDPKLIYQVKPNYTVDAMRAKIQGVVTMDVEVLANGSVDPRRIRIARSLDPGLDREAAIAVRQWRFRPSRLKGRPVASRVTVELWFVLR